MQKILDAILAGEPDGRSREMPARTGPDPADTDAPWRLSRCAAPRTGDGPAAAAVRQQAPGVDEAARKNGVPVPRRGEAIGRTERETLSDAEVEARLRELLAATPAAAETEDQEHGA